MAVSEGSEENLMQINLDSTRLHRGLHKIFLQKDDALENDLRLKSPVFATRNVLVIMSKLL